MLLSTTAWILLPRCYELVVTIKSAPVYVASWGQRESGTVLEHGPEGGSVEQTNARNQLGAFTPQRQ